MVHSEPPVRIAVIANLFNRPAEFEYLVECVRRENAVPLVIDVSIHGNGHPLATITREEVAGESGSQVLSLPGLPRHRALEVMVAGAVRVLKRLYRAGRLDGVLGMGSLTDTVVATAIMRSLPFGFPKVMISTVASGDTREFLGTKDITLIFSVTDPMGLDPISRRIIRNGVAAVCSMAKIRSDIPSAPRPVIGLTIFGLTTAAATACREFLNAAGCEVVVFPAVGTGGLALETLVRQGYMSGVLDLTTTELADELVGGVLSAGPDRLKAAGDMGIPQVVVPGALDMVNFASPETVPHYLEGRRFYRHNYYTTLLRTSPEENEALAQMICARLNAAKGPSALVVPARGFSALSVQGQPFHNPMADMAFIDTAKRLLKPHILFRVEDMEINDPRFARLTTELLMGFTQLKPIAAADGMDELADATRSRMPRPPSPRPMPYFVVD